MTVSTMRKYDFTFAKPALFNMKNGENRRMLNLFSNINMNSEYHQIFMPKGREWKTAYIPIQGLYEIQVMPIQFVKHFANFASIQIDTPS